MRRNNFSQLFMIMLACLFAGGYSCKDPYLIKTTRSLRPALVVEANLNTSAETQVTLSRSVALNAGRAIDWVNEAILYVEAIDHSRFPLAFTNNGRYAGHLPLAFGQQYRLHIQTADGRQYESAFVTYMKNPPIDSISFERTEQGVTIHANTHDPENKTRYYRWTFDEVYEFHSALTSRYLFLPPGVVYPQQSSAYPYVCWRYDSSKTLYLGSSQKLATDLIYHYPLVFYANNAEVLAIKYRIAVQQYALSKEAYDFYTMMKKNTELIGTIFDPQPTELETNFRCLSDPAEKVVGFLTASPVQEKVKFIVQTVDLPGWHYRMTCVGDTVKNKPEALTAAFNNYLLPYDVTRAGDYLMVENECIDCTIRGTSVRPAFW